MSEMTSCLRTRAARVCLPPALLALLPATLSAQIPGAARTNMDADIARARAMAMEEARAFSAAFRDAWTGQSEATVGSRYLAEATLSAPGGPWISGTQIGELAEAARVAAPDLRLSLVDFEHSEFMAYIFGTWEAALRDGAGETGRHVTLLMKVNDAWRIRAQLFITDSLDARVFPPLAQPEPLPPLAGRIEANVLGRVSLAGSRRTELRRSVYTRLALVLTEFRRAWNNRNADAVAELLGTGALIDLPMGRAAAGDIGRFFSSIVFLAYGRLSMADLDFEVDGTLAFVSGRYHLEQRAGGPRSGTWLAVFRDGGSGFHLRTIVFS